MLWSAGWPVWWGALPAPGAHFHIHGDPCYGPRVGQSGGAPCRRQEPTSISMETHAMVRGLASLVGRLAGARSPFPYPWRPMLWSAGWPVWWGALPAPGAHFHIHGDPCYG